MLRASTSRATSRLPRLRRHAVTVAVTAVALLAAPGLESVASGAAAPQQAPTSAVSAAAGRANTSIRFLDFDHTRGWLQFAYIRGQVTATKGGTHGALKGAHVRVYRKLDSQKTFHYLATRSTGTRPYPRFEFRTRALGNAVYKVVFRGNSSYQRTADATRVLVHRSMRADLEDGTGRFHGVVRPKYIHRTVYLEKRSCASCPWRKMRHSRTGDHGLFAFNVPAPRSGRWWWRASTPASGRFIWSYTGVFTTQLS